jgi:transmembrane sensor
VTGQIPADRRADEKMPLELAEALAEWQDRGRLSNEDVRAMRSRRRAAATGAAGGVAAVLLAIGFVQQRSAPTPDRVAMIQTQRGETRQVRLPDGSTLRLEGATRLSVRYGPTARIVTLADGAAFFDVAHDPARPFTVQAGDGAVRVLGTAFDVDRTAGRMDVSVYRGAVRVAGQGDTRGKWVPAGWRGQVIRGHAGPASRFDRPPDGSGQSWLDVDGLRLADLVTILNRRAGPEILPPAAPLGDIPISGRFRTDDPLSLLRSLSMPYSFEIHEEGHSVSLLQK